MILLLPVLVRDRAALDSARLGMPFEAALAVVNTAGGSGGVVGGIAVSIWGLRGVKRRVALMAGCLVVLGVGEVLVGLSTTVLTMSLAMFLGELLVAPLNTASFTLWQTLTPPHILARALSVRRFLAQSAFPIGTVVAGWMATVIEPWVVVTLSGAALAVYCSALFHAPELLPRSEDRMRRGGRARVIRAAIAAPAPRRSRLRKNPRSLGAIAAAPDVAIASRAHAIVTPKRLETAKRIR